MLCLKEVFLSCMVFIIVRPSCGADIIDGKEVQPHSMPYMALLLGDKDVCGGTLIDRKWVLTAAHCGPMKEVWLGVHNHAEKEKESRQVIQVKKRIPHPCYDKGEKVNDLMLLKLGKAAKPTKTVQELKISKTIQDVKAGTKCVVAGWGIKTPTSKTGSNALMGTFVTVIDRVKCNSPQHYNFDPIITKRMVCAGGDGKNRNDTCQGDSGGPLLCNGVQAGVTSFGKGCGQARYPGVYSLLSETQISWIKETMKKN